MLFLHSFPNEELALAMERLRSVETAGSLGDTMAPHLPNAQRITSQWTMPTEASLCSYRSLHILGSTEHKDLHTLYSRLYDTLLSALKVPNSCWKYTSMSIRDNHIGSFRSRSTCSSIVLAT